MVAWVKWQQTNHEAMIDVTSNEKFVMSVSQIFPAGLLLKMVT